MNFELEAFDFTLEENQDKLLRYCVSCKENYLASLSIECYDINNIIFFVCGECYRKNKGVNLQ